MEKVSQEWLECTCENCRRQVRFKSSEVGLAVCPFCHKQTLLRVVTTPREITPRKIRLPAWLLPALSLLAIAVLLAAALYQLQLYPLRQVAPGASSPLVFFFDLLIVAFGVLWILFWFTFSFHSGKCVRPSSRSNSTRGRPSCLPDHLSLSARPVRPRRPALSCLRQWTRNTCRKADTI